MTCPDRTSAQRVDPQGNLAFGRVSAVHCRRAAVKPIAKVAKRFPRSHNRRSRHPRVTTWTEASSCYGKGCHVFRLIRTGPPLDGAPKENSDTTS